MHQVFQPDEQKNQCPYCKADLKEVVWHTHFESIKMYKGFPCKCGHLITLPMSFLGSDHDNWDGTNAWCRYPNIKRVKSKEKIKTLESKIKIVKEYKMHP